MMQEATGVYGAILSYALLLALAGSTLLVFVYLWRKGRLDMDEGPKEQMMKGDDE